MSMLKNKVVIVTGGAQGIGRQCALTYSAEGATVVVLDIETSATIVCDVADNDSVQRAVEQVVKKYGRIDAIHNNAGIASPSLPLHETTPEQWDGLISVNLKSIYLTASSPHQVSWPDAATESEN